VLHWRTYVKEQKREVPTRFVLRNWTSSTTRVKLMCVFRGRSMWRAFAPQWMARSEQHAEHGTATYN